MDKKTQADCITALAYLNSGKQLYADGNRDAAFTCLKQALQLNPDCDEAHFLLGHLLYGMGDMNKAQIHFEHTIEINPDFLEACFYLGNILYVSGEYEKAKTCFERAIEITPDFKEGHQNLKGVLEAMGLPEMEIASYGKILKKDPNMSEAGPQIVRIETSSVCNLRCQHCPTGTSYEATTRGIMKMRLFEKILAQIKEMKSLYSCILYLGGEPFLNKNFPAMCRRIRNDTEIVNIQFNTNAMLINEEICMSLADSRIDRIGISLDGRSPEENDAVRLGSNYKKVVENVKMLRNYLKGCGIVIDNTIIKRLGDPKTPITPDFLHQDFPGLPISTNYAMKWPGLDIKKSSLKHLSVEKKQPYNFCNKPFTEMAIRSNGDITMCCYDILGEKIMGNIHNNKLMDVWTGSEYKKVRQNMVKREIDSLPSVCKKCVKYTGEIPIIVSQ